MSEITLELNSVCLSGPADVTVILPNIPGGCAPGDFYSAERSFKVLWLFHGGLNGARDWLRGTNIARYCQERGVMAVIPNAPNSDFVNHPEYADGFNFRDFFFTELMPFVRNFLHGSKLPEDNFLSGYSMGCQAAWAYGIMHPELFGGVIPLSSPPLDYRFLEPFRGLSSGEFRKAAAGDPVTFHAAYGPPAGLHTKEVNLIARYADVGEFLDSPEHTFSRFAEAAESGSLPRVYLTGGASDRALAAFKDYTDANGIEAVTFDIRDEFAHNFEFWDAAIQRGMDFFGL